jgi:hypothetical protein
MPFKHIDMKSLVKAQQKIEGELEKLKKVLTTTTNEEHLGKLNQTKERFEIKLQQLVPLYERQCSLAISQNQVWIELTKKNHQVAKDQLEKATKEVAEAEEGKKQAAIVLKRFEFYEKYIDGLLKQTETQGRELMDGMGEYRENAWYSSLCRIDSAIGEKRKNERIKSINDNTDAKAIQTRISEYQERLGLLRKRLEVSETSSGKLMDLANEVNELHERVGSESKEMLRKLDEVVDGLRESTAKIRRCKDHASAVKILPDYETWISARADRLPPLVKNTKGKLKTMELEKDGLAQRAKGHKPLVPVIQAIEKLLQESYDKMDEYERESVASRERLKTLLKTK